MSALPDPFVVILACIVLLGSMTVAALLNVVRKERGRGE